MCSQDVFLPDSCIFFLTSKIFLFRSDSFSEWSTSDLAFIIQFSIISFKYQIRMIYYQLHKNTFFYLILLVTLALVSCLIIDQTKAFFLKFISSDRGIQFNSNYLRFFSWVCYDVWVKLRQNDERINLFWGYTF